MKSLFVAAVLLLSGISAHADWGLSCEDLLARKTVVVFGIEQGEEFSLQKVSSLVSSENLNDSFTGFVNGELLVLQGDPATGFMYLYRSPNNGTIVQMELIGVFRELTKSITRQYRAGTTIDKVVLKRFNNTFYAINAYTRGHTDYPSFDLRLFSYNEYNPNLPVIRTQNILDWEKNYPPAKPYKP